MHPQPSFFLTAVKKDERHHRMNQLIRCPLKKSARQALSIGVGITMAACSLFRPYTITPLVKTGYPPTQTVSIIHALPEQGHTIIARFIGNEPVSCPAGEALCTLRDKARAAGAHAVWVQNTETYRHPGDWIMVEDRLTRIHPVTSTTYKGLFIRYTTHE
jgi:hypothetical protein